MTFDFVFVYSRNKNNSAKKNGFAMNNCLCLPSLGRRLFKGMRLKGDNLTYTYTEIYNRHFVRQSIEWGKVGAFKSYY